MEFSWVIQLTFRTNGPVVCLAQSKELKVPKGWVFATRYRRANGPAINFRTVGPLIHILESCSQPCESAIPRLGQENCRTVGPESQLDHPLKSTKSPRRRAIEAQCCLTERHWNYAARSILLFTFPDNTSVINFTVRSAAPR